MNNQQKTFGVVIVTYRSGDVIEACLSSLMKMTHQPIRVLVCDNASPDDTVDIVRRWAETTGTSLAEYQSSGSEGLSYSDLRDVTIINTGGNLGYAGGVNAGLKILHRIPEIDLFWVLNPDAEPEPDTASAFAEHAAEFGEFGLMGGRILYSEELGRIQSDGGRVNPWTGQCRNLNQGLLPDAASFPRNETLDFISGANVVASRRFLDSVGLMKEDYFLYYEEVDWAQRRGELKLTVAPKAVVHHIGGTAIGSGAVGRLASPFATYFNFRNRMRFVRRFHPWSLPTAGTFAALKIGQLLLARAYPEAYAALRGTLQLSPPSGVAKILPQDARELAFGRAGRN
ncbi:glycosyltransferase family 2 protein [Hwanghaeella grinnelliae]|uniref:Glycosyltransferase family 2 protein n=1 Tax=Hwanghaeella grinnelliae TaxID=2500179 RepID=A0A3S2Z6D7_9PROT|nr:glycosyltransferase family 2 protein [Hwanghaeella grinnelliae]RVU34104.1 glycosyltransferase family 2 protein [Hwanghaeella grinnelliae]